MKHNFSVLSIGFIFSFFLLQTSCTRINEATELGSDLIPAVDNVTTFEEILDVEAYNELFTFSGLPTDDSSRSTISNLQYLGTISSDPLFGKTKASMFFELKPSVTRFVFPGKDSLIGLDSVVLVLSYRDSYGDTTVPQSVSVFELSQGNKFRADSSYFLRGNSFQLGSQIAPTKTFIPTQLKDSVFAIKEKSRNQLRIPLNLSFGERLFNYDTTNAYATDSAFKTYFAGFAVVPGNSGNAVLGFALSDTNTKLAFYYRHTRAGKPDTTVAYFRATQLSAVANNVERDYSGSQLAGFLGGSAPDNLIFLQNSPGTYARLRIPALATLSNRIVHRAELVVQQVYDPSDATFPPPTFLFVDAFDSAKQTHRTIPYDFGFDINGNIDIARFGIAARRSTDQSGNPISTWRLNITRYVQHVVNKSEPTNYDLRLSAPFVLRDLFRNGTIDQPRVFSINPVAVRGRVRVGGTNHPTQPMKLRIIYSKL